MEQMVRWARGRGVCSVSCFVENPPMLMCGGWGAVVLVIWYRGLDGGGGDDGGVLLVLGLRRRGAGLGESEGGDPGLGLLGTWWWWWLVVQNKVEAVTADSGELAPATSSYWPGHAAVHTP